MSAAETRAINFFAEFIRKETGIIYGEENTFQLAIRLHEICKLEEEDSLESLHRRCLSSGISGTFKNRLVDIATNNETSFFRDIRVFDSFERLLVKKLKENVEIGEKIKLWSAASSTGQEAVSLAMILLEKKSQESTFPDFKITGTDISDKALEKARSGVYSSLEVHRGMRPGYLEKYFEKQEDDFVATPQIRNRMEFLKMNLLSIKLPSQQFDCVFCRNVLIYQSVENKEAVLKKMASYIKPNGYLVLGAAESLVGINCRFTHESVGNAIFYRKVED